MVILLNAKSSFCRCGKVPKEIASTALILLWLLKQYQQIKQILIFKIISVIKCCFRNAYNKTIYKIMKEKSNSKFFIYLILGVIKYVSKSSFIFKLINWRYKFIKCWNVWYFFIHFILFLKSTSNNYTNTYIYISD